MQTWTGKLAVYYCLSPQSIQTGDLARAQPRGKYVLKGISYYFSLQSARTFSASFALKEGEYPDEGGRVRALSPAAPSEGHIQPVSMLKRRRLRVHYTCCVIETNSVHGEASRECSIELKTKGCSCQTTHGIEETWNNNMYGIRCS